MKKLFYSHIVEIESVFVELDKLDLSETERHHLAKLVDANLHHTILDAVLSQLPIDDKKAFMDYLSREDDQKIWQLLNEKTEKIEEKIKQAADELKKKMYQDILESKKLKGKS